MILAETLACVQLLSDIGHCLIKTFEMLDQYCHMFRHV